MYIMFIGYVVLTWYIVFIIIVLAKFEDRIKGAEDMMERGKKFNYLVKNKINNIKQRKKPKIKHKTNTHKNKTGKKAANNKKNPE